MSGDVLLYAAGIVNRCIIAVLLLVCAAGIGRAATVPVYKTVNPDGSVSFSDQPQPGAVELHIAPVQTYQPPALPAPAPARAKPHAVSGYALVAIVSPRAGQTFHDGGGDVPVQVRVVPALHDGDRIAITLDGKEVETSVAHSFLLHNVFRGTHTLGARVIGANGEVRASAPTVTFYMHRTSRLLGPAYRRHSN